MTTPQFRIESTQPIVSSLPGAHVAPGDLLHDCDLAVAIAAKSLTQPPGGVVSVVHVPTGEVVFSKVSGWGDLSTD
jgi:hypothetical protein